MLHHLTLMIWSLQWVYFDLTSTTLVSQKGGEKREREREQEGGRGREIDMEREREGGEGGREGEREG